MSTDDPRNRRDDETADWPVTPPPNAPSDDDGEATQWIGAAPPPRPEAYPGPPSPRPPYGGPAQPWSSGPSGPLPPTGPSAAPGWAPRPGYPPQQGLPPQPGYAPPPPAGTDPPPPGKRKRYLIGGAAVVAIAVTVAAVLWTRGGGDITAGPATTTPTPTPVSVDPARLPQLLLPADAISTTLSAPGMVPGDVQASTDFTDSIVEPPNCTTTWGPGKEWTYQLSGFLGMARQLVAEQPTPTHAVVQAVLAFPDAAAATKSYDDQLKSWGDCQSKTITSHVGGSSKDQTAVVGAATEADGVATLQVTPDLGLPGVVCERALTVAGNVVVDVRSCSPNVGDTAGTIARDIATKIDPGR